jgi:hypothetical protein
LIKKRPSRGREVAKTKLYRPCDAEGKFVSLKFMKAQGEMEIQIHSLKPRYWLEMSGHIHAPINLSQHGEPPFPLNICQMDRISGPKIFGEF